jgi:hypothetical protein|eukprot:COSAG06_NODE_1877_length_8156_cov_8.117538_9_plen_126_part_00
MPPKPTCKVVKIEGQRAARIDPKGCKVRTTKDAQGNKRQYNKQGSSGRVGLGQPIRPRVTEVSGGAREDYIAADDRAAILKTLSAKSFRSGAATAIVTAGNAGFIAAAFLGHSDPKIRLCWKTAL